MFGTRKKVGLFLGPLLFLTVFLLPLPEGMKPQAQAVAAITVLMAAWWLTEAIPIPATSLLPIVLYPSLGVMKSAATTPAYAHHLIYLFIGGFLIAIAMQKWNLHRRIALKTIALVGVRPPRLVLGFMLATAFLSMWVSNTATAMMMLPIGIAVIEHAAAALRRHPVEGVNPDPPHFRFGVALMLGICWAASIGGVATLVGTPPNIVLAGMLEDMFGQKIGFARWMLFALPLACVTLAIAWVVLVKFLYPPELDELPGGTGVIQRELRALGPLSRAEKSVLIVFLLTALAWVARGFVHTSMVSDATIAMAAALSLFLIPVDFARGEFLLDWESAVGLPWGVVLLFGGGLALAKGFADSGLTAWVGQWLAAWQGMGLTAFIALLAALTMLVTEVTSNTATSTLLLPVMGAAAVAMKVHPFGPMIAATLAASYAFMLPVATPPNAVVYGSGYLTIGQMARAGVVLNVISVLLITGFVAYVLPWLWDIDLLRLPLWAR